MRLTDLNPRWLSSGGDGVFLADGSPAPLREGSALLLDCPCGACGVELVVPVTPSLDGTPMPQGWQRTGDTFETLTLTPSILRHTGKGGCGWHGFITAGAVLTC